MKDNRLLSTNVTIMVSGCLLEACDVPLYQSPLTGGDFQVKRRPDGSFIFIFLDLEEKEKVYNEGPWSIDNNLLVFKKWPPDKPLHEVDFSLNEFWVQIHGLPPWNWNKENAERIGNLFGGIICMDESTFCKQKQANYLRIRVCVKVSKPLRTGFFVTNTGGKRDWVRFKYERLPTFCFKCGIIGHIVKNCNTSENNTENREESDKQFRYGMWLVAKNSKPLPMLNPTQVSLQGNDPTVNPQIPQTKTQNISLSIVPFTDQNIDSIVMRMARSDHAPVIGPSLKLGYNYTVSSELLSSVNLNPQKDKRDCGCRPGEDAEARSQNRSEQRYRVVENSAQQGYNSGSKTKMEKKAREQTSNQIIFEDNNGVEQSKGDENKVKNDKKIVINNQASNAEEENKAESSSPSQSSEAQVASQKPPLSS
ncbi:hypothetical protein GH714_019655 [Hevea brasiliensis]|uniref:CCHC-type domain-containing protein n=1 Tax=Hevea brasiliensis TaxID=3981 RepID=A0A6A6L9T4_HEVBR|nr:hypothetical protein GH714_019655 [Hevea brasiliensis]